MQRLWSQSSNSSEHRRELSSVLCPLSLSNPNLHKQFSINSLREETDLGECETRDSITSDSCSDECESEKLWRCDGCSSEDGGLDPCHSLWHLKNRLGYLYFQFMERSNP